MDEELERLKRKRMMDLQRRLLKEEKAKEEDAPPEPREPTPKEILEAYFVGRAWEVYNTAVAQYPTVMPRIEAALVEAIKGGKIKDRIDGESLFVFLRQVGLPVRLQTSIRYKEHGELKTIGQRIKEK